jgi:hypothetical protein
MLHATSLNSNSRQTSAMLHRAQLRNIAASLQEYIYRMLTDTQLDGSFA